MSVMVEGLILGWDRNLDYMKRLLADVPQEKMALQPLPKMNHPAWILSHLNIYHRPIEAMLLGEDFEDTKDHKFGMKSICQPDASLYEDKAVLLDAFIKGHEKVSAALRKGGQPALEKQTPLERWRANMPKVGIVLPYLMLVHESTHLGQISTWRRVQGMPSV